MKVWGCDVTDDLKRQLAVEVCQKLLGCNWNRDPLVGDARTRVVTRALDQAIVAAMAKRDALALQEASRADVQQG